jgi:formate dehydrogenase subunit beta
MVNIEDLKSEARRVLKGGKVKYIIGYERASETWKANPVFLRTPEAVDKLVWDPTCFHNLVRFVVDEKRRKAKEKQPDTRPVGIVVKGCDSRAIIVLLQEKFIERMDVYIIGVSCESTGVIDERKLAKKTAGKTVRKVEFGEKQNYIVTTEDGTMDIPAAEIMADRCLECIANIPVVSDHLLGDKTKRAVARPFQSVEKLESLSQEDKWKFWTDQMKKCIRCYACRSACPMCYCDECVVDTINFAVTADTTAEEKAQRIKWLEKSPVDTENVFYHLVRAIHLAGRCIDCGECERACPVNIPLRMLNKKMEKEAKELFGYDVGFDADQPALISCFRDGDPEDFIR